MFQKWRHLLFLHWRVDTSELQETLPPGLEVDTFEGSGYVGIVPFFMVDVRPRLVPPLPWLSRFLELNVRTYVRDSRGRTGVWFYSLFANRRLVVALARRWFLLPYHMARMQARCSASGCIDFDWKADSERASFRYLGRSTPQHAAPGTLAHFLVERYVLFVRSPATGDFLTASVEHRPYMLQEAELPRWDDRLLEHFGVRRPCRYPDHACVSAGVDVQVFPLA